MNTVEIDGVEYHVVKISTRNCFTELGINCHFRGSGNCGDRTQICDPDRDATSSHVFLTDVEYTAHIAKRMTS